MQLPDAIARLQHWASLGRVVFTRQDMATLFAPEPAKSLTKSLDRLVSAGVLVRACRGVYVNALALGGEARMLERIAVALRRGQYSYLSLEAMLAEYGAISQVPMDRLTVMTTGRKGEYRTPFGVIEFTHTRRSVADILAATRSVPSRPLRLAQPLAAWRDLKRVGRNIHLVERQVLQELQELQELQSLPNVQEPAHATGE